MAWDNLRTEWYHHHHHRRRRRPRRPGRASPGRTQLRRARASRGCRPSRRRGGRRRPGSGSPGAPSRLFRGRGLCWSSVTCLFGRRDGPKTHRSERVRRSRLIIQGRDRKKLFSTPLDTRGIEGGGGTEELVQLDVVGVARRARPRQAPDEPHGGLVDHARREAREDGHDGGED